MRRLFFGLLLLALFVVSAQEERVLTLDECIQLAINRNLTIKQNENSLMAAESNRRQAYFNFLPDLNISGGYSISEGSFFDNNSGQFATATTRSSNPEISSGLNVFSGFSNHYQLKRRKHEYNSSLYRLEDSKVTTQVAVIENYLNVLLGLENLRVSDERLSFLKSQFDREKKRMDVGVGSLESVYSFQSAIATEENANLSLRNQNQLNMLSLKQLLQFNVMDEIQIQPLEVDSLSKLTQVEEYDVVLQDILRNSFQLKSAEQSKKATQNSLGEARAQRYPSIGAGAGYGTQYSSNNEGDFVSQIENLNYQYIGASVSIPIFNNYATQNSIETTKVNYLNAQIAEEQAILDVTNTFQRVYLDLVAAQTAYKTSVDNFEAVTQSFEFMKKRFETGNSDFYSYLDLLNNKNRAEAQLINAKYTIVFRKMILDVYRGV